MEKIKITFDVFEGDGKQNELMHAMDVFEKGKQFQFEAEVDGEVDYCDIINHLAESFISTGRNLVFLSIRDINGVPNTEIKPYIMPDVQSISTGHQWGMFQTILEEIGYEVESNKHKVEKTA